MTDSQTALTTAEGLGALRTELLVAGFDPDSAQAIVMAYVYAVADGGFCVKEKVQA